MYSPYWLMPVAALIAYFTTPLAIYVARKFSLLTDKTIRRHPAHTHNGVIPRAGGIPIYIALLICSLYFLTPSKILNAVLISNFLLLVMGLLDDKYDLSPYWRFAGNFLIAAIVVAGGLGIPYISNPLGGVIHLDTLKWSFTVINHHSILIFADLVAIIWLVWTMNMVNWSKGVDGQLPGFVGITAFFLAILSQRFVAHDIHAKSVMELALTVSGAFLGFLPYNFYPQKIMPGYGGGAMAGFLLGILSILSFGKVGTAILILAIPTIDALYTILRRLKHRSSPFKADWGHFHHRLLEIGWGKRRIAVFYWSISFLLGISSLFLNGVEKLIAFMTVCLTILFFMVILDRLKKNTTSPTQTNTK